MQEPKYDFRDGQVFNRASGEVIPADEPVFVFRARDRHAAAVIAFYASLVADETHRDIVHDRLADFVKFQAEHPDRMHEPGTGKA